MVQKIVSSGNCLQSLESPAKIHENFTEKSTISVYLQQKFEKVSKNYEKVQKSENFEMEAVQKSANLVELEKCCKM